MLILRGVRYFLFTQSKLKEPTKRTATKKKLNHDFFFFQHMRKLALLIRYENGPKMSVGWEPGGRPRGVNLAS
jgi:hypothetical protein